MAKSAQAIPRGFHTVTPSIVVAGAAKALDFYKKAFGAEELSRFPGPDGNSIMHAEFKIGDSVIMLGDEMPDMGSRGPKLIGGSPVSFFIYGENVDAAWKRAVDAGATVVMPLADQFWGDRTGCLGSLRAQVVAGPADPGALTGRAAAGGGQFLLPDAAVIKQ
jgi:uncharacterized glyoxalase superfamily protein PhnB